jgi:hypothetical protein
MSKIEPVAFRPSPITCHGLQAVGLNTPLLAAFAGFCCSLSRVTFPRMSLTPKAFNMTAQGNALWLGFGADNARPVRATQSRRTRAHAERSRWPCLFRPYRARRLLVFTIRRALPWAKLFNAFGVGDPDRTTANRGVFPACKLVLRPPALPVKDQRVSNHLRSQWHTSRQPKLLFQRAASVTRRLVRAPGGAARR